MTSSQDQILEKIEKEYPFLTYVRWKGISTIGIVQNVDNKVLMIYDFTKITTQESKIKFLKLGERWWFESSTEHPIEIYLGEAFDEFFSILKGYPICEIEEIVGPVINLDERLTKKRIKRRRTELVRDI